MADTNKIPGQSVGDEIAQEPSPSSAEGDEWMRLAKDAYKRSTTYFDNNYRKTWEDGLRLFNSQHPRDSKYNSDAYKYRSRLFRPKTRSVIRRHEATAAMAFFSNPDVTSIDPVDQDDDEQIASAEIMKELLQYRLTKSIPWFLTAIGAFQDAMTVGICASFQYWDYATERQKVTKQAQFMGMTIPIETEEDVPVVDKPCCELIPIQNSRFDPAAKWNDVVNSSPYIIVQLPMYLRDVLDRMERGYGKDETGKWKTFDKKTILEARLTDLDTLTQAREGRREDPQKVTSEVNEFDVVMVHLNFIKTEDGCFCYYTLKDKELLSEPVELKEAFLHGEIPVTIGFCVIETHKPMPSGLSQIGAQLQAEANEIANQRLDNVKLVLNKRYFIRRGSNIDVENLLRNVPGGVSMANDVEKDVREITWTDVTASSFQEQDRLNVDFDDLEGGGLNTSSVMTNRRLNETVGGMKIMAQGANSLTEYTIRVFVETWVEPTLRQLVKLEQYYESDEVVLGIAAQRAGHWQHFQVNPNLDRLLKQELTLNVNVGMGATDPEARFQRFMQAFGAYAQMSQTAPPDSNLPEIRKELFGLAGFKDSKRFFNNKDPIIAKAGQLMQQAEGMAGKVIDQHKMALFQKERALDNREHDIEMRLIEEQQNFQVEMRKQMQEFQLKLRDQQVEHAMDIQKFRQESTQKMVEHRFETALSREKAQQEANIKVFQAGIEAAIKKFLAQVDATAKLQQAEAAKPRKRTAVKEAPGKWEVT